MPRKLKDAGSQCWEVYDDHGRPVARIVPHDTDAGWKLVDIKGNSLSTRSFESPELAEKYLPSSLPIEVIINNEDGKYDDLWSWIDDYQMQQKRNLEIRALPGGELAIVLPDIPTMILWKLRFH